MLKDDDILVLAGSIPNGIENNIYEIICERLRDKKIKVIVDATSKLLTNVLKYKPYLIKPNDEELSEIFNVEIKDENDAYIYAKKIARTRCTKCSCFFRGKRSINDRFGKK